MLFKKKVIKTEIKKPIVRFVNYKVSLFNTITKTYLTINGKIEIPCKKDFRVCVESLEENKFTWGGGSLDSCSTNYTSLDYDTRIFSRISSVFWYTEEERETSE